MLRSLGYTTAAEQQFYLERQAAQNKNNIYREQARQNCTKIYRSLGIVLTVGPQVSE